MSAKKPRQPLNLTSGPDFYYLLGAIFGGLLLGLVIFLILFFTGVVKVAPTTCDHPRGASQYKCE
jgi:hypothetical protein